MCRYLKQRANRFCGAYNYGLNIIRSAFLANMANGEWFRHVRELSRKGETVVDKWRIIKCPECGRAYVFDPSIKSCHHCLERCMNPKVDMHQKKKHANTRKQCAECGRIFMDSTLSQRMKYCSNDCRKEAQRKQNARWYAKKKEVINSAKASECAGNQGTQTDRQCG